jgi:hypothetical protein
MSPGQITQTIIAAPAVQSLCWQGNDLVDWVGGGRVLRLDGSVEASRVSFGYRFDAALVSPSGRFVAIYERLGTKALLLKDGQAARELNRSYYHADAYEYPIAFLRRADGEELIAHCPQDYCRIDIESADSGKCLTDAVARKPADVFHSRLAFSPEGGYLLSAGWFWHPFDVAGMWAVASVLADPARLDRMGIDIATSEEVSAIAFIDESHLIASLRNDERDDAVHHLAVVRATDGQVLRQVGYPGATGPLYPVGPDRVVAFHQHPRLIDSRTGEVLHEWPGLQTGLQTSSIIHHLPPLPALALHPQRAMFAVADAEKVTVVAIGSGP